MLHELEGSREYRLARMPVLAVRSPQPDERTVRMRPLRNGQKQQLRLHEGGIVQSGALVRPDPAASGLPLVPGRVNDQRAVFAGFKLIEENASHGNISCNGGNGATQDPLGAGLRNL